MAAGSTYTPIATTTTSGSQASVTFNSFSGYTDLILIIAAKDSNGSLDGNANITFNSDTGSNYSTTYLYGTGSVAGSTRVSNANNTPALVTGSTANNFGTTIVQIMNYSNSTTYKTVLSRGNSAESVLAARVGLWRNTAAITSLTATAAGGSWVNGSTFTLYGIAAA